MSEVFIAGAGMTRFGGYPPGQGRAVAAEAGAAALRDTGCDLRVVDAVYLGSALPDSPRGVFVARELGLTGVPVQHVTNASASGLAALHEAWLAVRSGAHDIVLVIGYDLPERAVTAAETIADQGFIPPAALFGMWANRRMHDVGTTPRHLALVAAKNWNYARRNPYAVRRADAQVTPERVLGSRRIAGPLTSMMCTPWGDGAAAAVVTSEAGLARLTSPRWPIARLAASSFDSEIDQPGLVLEGAIVGSPELIGRSAAAALTQAGFRPGDLDIVQIHDAFAIEEIVYVELLGLSEPGHTEDLLEKGAFGPGSRAGFGLAEVSTDGGLIARGHASGGTGLAQVHETLRRFRTVSEDRVGLCQLFGAGGICITEVFTRVEKP